MSISEHPIPQTVADRLRAIPVGESRLMYGIPVSTIRSTITRMKARGVYDFTTRPSESGGLRVWRLA